MINYSIVGDNVRWIVMQINALFSTIFEIIQDPNLLTNIIANVNPSIIDAVKATAITLVTLFFLLDFFTKTLHLQWVTWENVLMLFLKLTVAKLCVDNALWITQCIFNGFSSLSSSVPSFYSLIPQGGDWGEAYSYFLNGDEKYKVMNNVAAGFLDFTPLLVNLKVTIQGFIMQAIMIITFVIVVTRFLELTIYSVVAPLPMSTLACEGLTDVGKGFLKSFAAACLQAMVILVIFYGFAAVNSVLDRGMYQFGAISAAGGWMGLIKTFILGGTVLKSEQWAKRICGAM